MSPKNTKQVGNAAERAEVEYRREQGWVAFRVGGTRREGIGAADDFSVCDVLAIQPWCGWCGETHAIERGEIGGVPYVTCPHVVGPQPTGRAAQPIVATVLFIEVKANKKGGAFMNFRKEDREALILAARAAGAIPLLVHYGVGMVRREYPVETWPNLQ